MLTAPGSVLHFAPETVTAKLLKNQANLDYVSGDLQPGLAMEVMDITAIPRPDETFDLVLCNHVLEHISDDRRAMTELFRVLKRGGRAYMQHPIDFGLASTHEDPAVTTREARLREFGQEDHVRTYGRDFENRLRSAGFDVEHRDYVEELPGAVVERLALRNGPRREQRGSDIFICARPEPLAMPDAPAG